MKKNFFYYLLPSIITGIIGLFVIVPVSTYYLDPKDFGVVAIVTVFSGLVVPISSVGYSWVLSAHYYKISHLDKSELIFNLLFVGILLRTFWVLIFGAAGFLFLSKFIKSYEPVFFWYFIIFLITEWFNHFGEVVSYTIILQKKGNMYAFLEIVKILSRLSVLIFSLAVLHLKTTALVLSYLAEGIGSFLFSVIYIKRYVVLKVRKSWIKEIVKLGFPTIPLNLFEIISNSIGNFFIERWIGLYKLGIYNYSTDYKKAFILPQRAFSKFYSPIILEDFSKDSQTDAKPKRDILRKWFSLLALAGVGITLFSKDIIAILTHRKFIDAAPLVSLWFILILIYTLGIPYTQFLLANKKNKFIFISEISLGIVSWGIIALSVKFFGILGATTAVIIYFFILHFIRRLYAIKLGCDNFEGHYFFLTTIGLLFLMFSVNMFSLSILIKIILMVISTLLIFKYYDLPSLKMLLIWTAPKLNSE